MFPLIEEWKRSGLSQKELSNQHGINPHVFGYWLRRYRENREASKAAGFVSVEMEQRPIESVLAEVIYPSGTRLVFKERVGLAFLQSLLSKA